VLVEDNEIQEELAGNRLLSDGVLLDAALGGPLLDVLFEELLGVSGGAFLAIVVDRKAKPLTPSLDWCNLRGEKENCRGAG